MLLYFHLGMIVLINATEIALSLRENMYINKSLILFLITLFISVPGYSQSPEFQWARRLGPVTSPTNDGSLSWGIDIDKSGNVYTTGYFWGNNDFDPGSSEFLIDTDYSTAYISKLDKQGNFVWAKHIQLGSSFSSVSLGNSIAIDKKGNVYSTGSFRQEVDFDPGAGIYNLTASILDTYVWKLNASGEFVWAKQMGGMSSNEGYTITTDESGDVYITGAFEGSTDFDPGVAVYQMTSTGKDGFICKLDSNGNFKWAHKIGGSGFDECMGISVSLTGTVYVSGVFENSVDFDPGITVQTLTASAQKDAYILKLGNNGQFIWVKQLAGSGDEYAYSVTLDKKSSLYIGGGFNAVTDFDPSAENYSLTTSGHYDGFIAKFDTLGMLKWASQLGGTMFDMNYGIAVDDNADVYSMGNFAGTANFSPSSPNIQLTSIYGFETYVAKADSTGRFLWASKIGGQSNGWNPIRIDSLGQIYTSGQFADTKDFDPGPGVYTLTALGGRNTWVHKMSQCKMSDTTITLIGATLVANAQQASFQWMNCITDQLILGAVGNVFSPIQSGNYAVIVSQKSCVDTSSCYNIKVENCLSAITANPNITSSLVNVYIPCPGITLRIYNAIGQLMRKRNFISSVNYTEDISNFASGIYFFVFDDGKRRKAHQIVNR